MENPGQNVSLKKCTSPDLLRTVCFRNLSGHIWSIRPSLLCQLEKDGAPENGGDTFNMATLRGNMMIWLVVGTPYPSEKWWSERQLGLWFIPNSFWKVIIHSCSKPPTSDHLDFGVSNFQTTPSQLVLVLSHVSLENPCKISNLVGGWATYPSEKWWSEFVSWDDEIPKIWKNEKSSKPPTSHLILGIYKQTFEIWSWVAFEICLAKKGEIITASIGLFKWKNTKNLTLCKLDPILHFSLVCYIDHKEHIFRLKFGNQNITWYWPLLTATHYLGIHQWKAQLVYPGKLNDC